MYVFVSKKVAKMIAKLDGLANTCSIVFATPSFFMIRNLIEILLSQTLNKN